MDIRFEQQRMFVAARTAVVFFAWVGEEKIRCYIEADALVGPARGLREQADLVKRCLIEFDARRSAIESAAARLIRTNQFEEDGTVAVARAALGWEIEPPLEALARERCALDSPTSRKPRAKPAQYVSRRSKTDR